MPVRAETAAGYRVSAVGRKLPFDGVDIFRLVAERESYCSNLNEIHTIDRYKRIESICHQCVSVG